LILLAIISGAGAALIAVANPEGYRDKRRQAGLETDFLNPRISTPYASMSAKS
jgi:hypothetical protein